MTSQAVLSDVDSTFEAIQHAVKWGESTIIDYQLQESKNVDTAEVTKAFQTALVLAARDDDNALKVGGAHIAPHRIAPHLSSDLPSDLTSDLPPISLPISPPISPPISLRSHLRSPSDLAPRSPSDLAPQVVETLIDYNADCRLVQYDKLWRTENPAEPENHGNRVEDAFSVIAEWQEESKTRASSFDGQLRSVLSLGFFKGSRDKVPPATDCTDCH